MKLVWNVAFLFLTIVFQNEARAQLDSSYELLLLGTPTRKVDYNIVPTPEKLTKKRKPASQTLPTKVEVPTKPVVVQPVKETSTSTGSSDALEEPSFSQQAKSLLNSNRDRVFDFYEGRFDETDYRNNKVEVSFAPAFVTAESASNFSYRNYRSVFSAMNLGADVWVTPALGLGGTFLFSLGGDTSGDALNGIRSPIRQEKFDVALKFRKFGGYLKTSNAVEFALLFSDYKVTVPADDIYRARLKTSGLGLKMTLRIPSSSEVAWYLGGSFFPRLQHVEEKTGLDIKSGSNIENTRLGLQVGSEVVLSRQGQIFYEASITSDKHLFDGASNLTDPTTGSTVKNVSVTNSLYMFSMGYRWGN